MFGFSRKQLVYGGIFIGIFGFAAIIVIVWIIVVLKPEPTCFDGIQNQDESGIDCGGVCGGFCLPSDLKPVSLLERPEVFYVGTSRASVLLALTNPNADFAAMDFDYRVTIWGTDGRELQRISGRSFIYAQEIKYILIPALNFSAGEIDRIDFEFENPVWVPRDKFPKPSFDILKKETVLEDGELVVAGSIVNHNSIMFRKVRILAVFKSLLGHSVGASETEIQNVAARETRPFIIRHPSIPKVDLSATEVLVFAREP